MRKAVVSLITAVVLGALALVAGPVSAASATDQAGQAGKAGIIATFGAESWGKNTFKVRFTDPEQIARVRASYAGTESSFPLGRIDYSGPAENVGWSWHLRNVQMVEQSTEVCDGQPTDVEAHAITSPYYCPWSAKVVAIQELG